MAADPRRRPTRAEGLLAGLASWPAQKDLFHQRAPGNTCLSALYASLPGRAQNNSKGCGGVMRAAPGSCFWFSHQPGIRNVFEAGVEMAAITHGHPTGYLTAAVFAALIAQLVRGDSFRDALRWAKTELPQHKGHLETLHAIENAERVARSTSLSAHGAIENLGGGWVAEEALAIAALLRTEGTEFGGRRRHGRQSRRRQRFHRQHDGQSLGLHLWSSTNPFTLVRTPGTQRCDHPACRRFAECRQSAARPFANSTLRRLTFPLTE